MKNNQDTRRKQFNILIANRILELIEMFPDVRFHQLLQVAEIEIPYEDRFYEELKSHGNDWRAREINWR
ncbi:MAG: hypothetical protein ACI4CE_07340 [Methanomethylophilus alvi]